jgi:hypothetical protein
MEPETVKKRRRRVKQTISLGERLLRIAREARDAAGRLPPGADHARLMNQAREAEAVANLDQYLQIPTHYPRRPLRDG